MRLFMKKLRVEIENETRVYHESLNFEIEMRVSQKSAAHSRFEKTHFPPDASYYTTELWQQLNGQIRRQYLCLQHIKSGFNSHKKSNVKIHYKMQSRTTEIERFLINLTFRAQIITD